MSDKPILFSAPMVRALLAGTKTQTRRLLRPQPYEHFGRWQIVDRISGDCHLDLWARGDVGCRPVMPQDRLWVREHWRVDAMFDGTAPRDMPSDRNNRPCVRYEADQHGPGVLEPGRFRQSMFMPRWASRMTLTITDVRVERLQDISEADAWAEGCKKGDPDDVGGFFPAEDPDPSGIGFRGWDTACDWYADLWDEINGEGAWDANPWVAAYTFKVVLHNIDRAIA